jgi:hypothetical protein
VSVFRTSSREPAGGGGAGADSSAIVSGRTPRSFPARGEGAVGLGDGPRRPDPPGGAQFHAPVLGLVEVAGRRERGARAALPPPGDSTSPSTARGAARRA